MHQDNSSEYINTIQLNGERNTISTQYQHNTT